MKAHDVMTTTVVSVDPDTPVSAIAKTLSEHGISAVLVLDHSGAALGMASEGDLIGRDWWLTMLEGEMLSPEFLGSLRIEVAIAVGVLNRMLELGRPEYVRIA